MPPRRAGVRLRGGLLATQIQSDAQTAGALLEQVGRGPLQVEAHVHRRPGGARSLHLLRSKLLPNHNGAVDDRGDLREDPELVGLLLQAVLEHAERPAGDTQYLVEPADRLFTRDVLELDAAANVLKGGFEWG